MKTTIKNVLTMLVILSINYSIVAQENSNKKIEFNLEIHKYSDNVIGVQTDNGGFSQLALNTDKGVVIFGSHWGPDITIQYVNKIYTAFKSKIQYIINDSPRLIYTGGNYLFPDAVIIAQEEVNKVILEIERNLENEINKEIALFTEKATTSRNYANEEDRSEEFKEDYNNWANTCQRISDDLKLGYTFKKPNLVFKEQLSLDLGNLTLELTQSPFNNGGIIIWIPEEGILKTKLFHDSHIINRGLLPNKKEDVDELLRILDGFIAKGDQVKQVILWVSGTWSIDTVKERTDYLHLLWDEINKATASKSNFESVQESLSLNNKFSFVKQWPLYKKKGDIDGGLEYEHNVLLTSFWKLLHPTMYQYMIDFVQQNGADNGITELKSILKNRQNEYFIDERGMNGLGYQFLSDSKMELALEVFKAYVNLYPNSANAYDSLGETYMNNGDKEKAIFNYEKSLELNPNNNNAKEMLKSLKN